MIPLKPTLLRLLAWIKSPWRKDDTKPPSNFLQLPVELVRSIGERLPLRNQLVLGLTCRDLRVVFYHRRDSPKNLSHKQFLEYLAVLARDMPDKWVCELCMDFHPIITSDTPSLPEMSSCPLESMHVDYNLLLFRLKHRHVQLTLKYTRVAQLDRRYRNYLKALLSTTQSTFSTHQFERTSLITRLDTYPKVVKGNYLLLSILQYTKNLRAVSPYTMGSLRICQHQDLAFPSGQRLRLFFRYGPWRSQMGLSRIVDSAFDSPGIEIQGYCPGCPTDFTVQATSEQATIRIWQNLGTESPPLRSDWVVHTYEYLNFRRRPVEYLTYKKPGTVRSLYEK
ncbi:hypothetical protein QQX98_010724 [Neonectria punicea]|uniref:F-box domain-containing protein n=1 Tax=Neonectria punicea TaxID=979145 RepID=A0ABR1GNN2_9HYPO